MRIHFNKPFLNHNSSISTAFNYLSKRKQALSNKNSLINDISLYDSQKLEGIQYGIPLFEGISFAQIKFMLSNMQLIEFVTKRGCSNRCIHCYANAKPDNLLKKQGNLTEISFNDLETMSLGFKELNERLGFNSLTNGKNCYDTLFHDADSSAVFLNDETGKSYDYLDIAEKIHDFTQRTLLFDTSGWNVQDKRTQERMEALVEKALNSDKYDFMEYNISLNPFSPLYNLSVKYKNSGDISKSDKFRELYVSRISNVIFTFSKLFLKKQVDFLSRAFGNNVNGVAGYWTKDLKLILDDIQRRLHFLYIRDLKSDKKVVDSEAQVYEFLDYFKQNTKDISTQILDSKRLKENLGNVVINRFDKNDTIRNAINDFSAGIIDVNGRYYVTNWAKTFKTDIVLNFKNKNAKTPDIDTELQKEIITRNMLK